MDINGEKLRAELETLSRLKLELEEQDTLILELARRAPNTAVGAPQITLLEAIFGEVNALRPGLLVPFARTDDPDNLRPQIRSARARVDEQIKALQLSLDASARIRQRSDLPARFLSFTAVTWTPGTPYSTFCPESTWTPLNGKKRLR
jgi:hypothetical protein